MIGRGAPSDGIAPDRARIPYGGPPPAPPRRRLEAEATECRAGHVAPHLAPEGSVWGAGLRRRSPPTTRLPCRGAVPSRRHPRRRASYALVCTSPAALWWQRLSPREISLRVSFSGQAQTAPARFCACIRWVARGDLCSCLFFPPPFSSLCESLFWFVRPPAGWVAGPCPCQAERGHACVCVAPAPRRRRRGIGGGGSAALRSPPPPRVCPAPLLPPTLLLPLHTRLPSLVFPPPSPPLPSTDGWGGHYHRRRLRRDGRAGVCDQRGGGD